MLNLLEQNVKMNVKRLRILRGWMDERCKERTISAFSQKHSRNDYSGTGIFYFYYVWNKYYSRGLWIEPFYAKGNIFIVLVYAAFMLLFLYIYGGFKIGYIKRGNLIYSQALSGLCANVIMYLQIVLLYRRLPDVRPLLAMTLADLLVIGICSYF